MTDALTALVLDAIERDADMSVTVRDAEGRAITEKIELTGEQKVELKARILGEVEP